jgi:hypothetical protein
MPVTKLSFCTQYEQTLRDMYEWARDENKLARFMHSVTQTLDGENSWNANGDALEVTCRTLGMGRRVTLKALRALPVDEEAMR